MTRIFFDTQVVMSGSVPDGDMDADNTTSWTNTGLATFEKVTTASRVYSGIRSLHTLANSANDYAVTASAIRVFGNTPFYCSAGVHVAVGEVSLIVYDSTNSAVIGTAVTTSERQWGQLWCTGTIPPTCKEVLIRLNSVTSTADAYWDHLVFYPRNNRLFPAPSWLDEQFKFLKLREARYDFTISSQTAGGYNDGGSRSFSDWLTPSMFTLDPLHLDANPYQIQLQRPLPERELWIQGKRPYSDLEPLSTEASTTRAPLHLVYAYCKDEIAKSLRKRYPTDDRWKILEMEAANETDIQTRSRPELPMQPVRNEHWGYV